MKWWKAKKRRPERRKLLAAVATTAVAIFLLVELCADGEGEEGRGGEMVKEGTVVEGEVWIFGGGGTDWRRWRRGLEERDGGKREWRRRRERASRAWAIESMIEGN